MADDITWMDAIIRVLKDEKKALLYTEIAEKIISNGYRKTIGATPANTVNAFLNDDIKKNANNSPFAKVDRGIFILRDFLNSNSTFISEDISKPDIQISFNKIIHSYGIYWDRSSILWKSSPNLYGVQLIGANEINFKDQIGIYLLHDGRETIYIGQSIDNPISKRLHDHTIDRLNGRWDRFTWFGFYSVKENGELDKSIDGIKSLTFKELANILEAILIESIEPRQNRKRGDNFSGIEFIQKQDPDIKRKNDIQAIQELLLNKVQ